MLFLIVIVAGILTGIVLGALQRAIIYLPIAVGITVVTAFILVGAGFEPSNVNVLLAWLGSAVGSVVITIVVLAVMRKKQDKRRR